MEHIRFETVIVTENSIIVTNETSDKMAEANKEDFAEKKL